MLLNLMGEDEKLPVAGRVIWMTPKGAQGKRTAGIGVQFSEQDRGNTQRKIESLSRRRSRRRQAHPYDVNAARSCRPGCRSAGPVLAAASRSQAFHPQRATFRRPRHSRSRHFRPLSDRAHRNHRSGS